MIRKSLAKHFKVEVPDEELQEENIELKEKEIKKPKVRERRGAMDLQVSIPDDFDPALL